MTKPSRLIRRSPTGEDPLVAKAHDEFMEQMYYYTNKINKKLNASEVLELAKKSPKVKMGIKPVKGVAGSYYPDEDMIEITEKSLKKDPSALFHEMEHRRETNILLDGVPPKKRGDVYLSQQEYDYKKHKRVTEENVNLLSKRTLKEKGGDAIHHFANPKFEKRFNEHLDKGGTPETFFNLHKQLGLKVEGGLAALKKYDENANKRIKAGREIGVNPDYSLQKHKPRLRNGVIPDFIDFVKDKIGEPQAPTRKKETVFTQGTVPKNNGSSASPKDELYLPDVDGTIDEIDMLYVK